MEIVEETIKRYLEKCPFCHRDIKGNSEDAMKYNLKLHLDACEKNPSNRENVKN